MKIKNEIFEIRGAPLEGLNPLPKFRRRKPDMHKTSDRFPAYLKEDLGTYTKVLPYLMQDRYSRKRLPLKLKSFVLENKYLKARFLPEYGGRLHSLYDKVNRQELLFTNTVIQPGNLALRNAWLSGGIEWNIGSLDHTFTTCDNVFCAKLDDGEGNTFIRIYEFERLKSIFWQVDFHLPDGAKHLITHVRMVNPFPVGTTTYWWSNVAVPDNGKTRILASGKNVISFVDGKMINTYACSNELMGSSLSGIGTLCHEFGHVMGMPDFYDTQYGTNYNNCLTPNDWDVMDGGAYNGDGHCPPNYSPWEKEQIGYGPSHGESLLPSPQNTAYPMPYFFPP